MSAQSWRVATASALAAALALSVPAWAGGGTLASTPYAAVDLGDAIAWTGTGHVCASSVVAEVTSAGRRVNGPQSPHRAGSGCGGTAYVPTFAALRRGGWRQGDPITLALVGGGQRVPLRYQRVEVDAAKPVAGSPVAGTASTPDPDTGAYDRAMAMATGDAVDLGRVDLEASDSAAVRSCMLGRRIIPPGTVSGGDSTTDAPVRISLRQDSPTGPALIQHYPLSDDVTTATRIASPGFGPTCWRLTSIPFTGRPVEAAPRLFLVVDFALPGTLEVNSIDLNGTPADPRAPRWVAPDPSGMRTLFDGRSFRGWTQTGCVLRERAATTLRTGGGTPPAGCSMKSAVVGANRIIRLEVRRESFYDNAAIGVPSEVQMRSVGEYLPGGYFQEYAARWQKLYAFPFWSTLEVVQLGARYVVRINGRTVTDHLASKGAPAPWQLSLATQPQFSYDEEAGVGFGSEFAPRVGDPGDWGGFWFRNVRSYQCTSLHDPVCVAYATINEGQAPRV